VYFAIDIPRSFVHGDEGAVRGVFTNLPPAPWPEAHAVQIFDGDAPPSHLPKHIRDTITEWKAMQS